MASSTSSNVEPDAVADVIEEEEEEEVIQHFDDFTIASSWERFISEIETVIRSWMADGPKNLLENGAVLLGCSKNSYKVKSEMTYAMKSYSMEYYFEKKNNDSGDRGKLADWNPFHDLQLCFGVKEFLVIVPQSGSGVVLDAPEASKLLSSVAIALSNCSSLWPAFVQVHDPSRKAYIGIQSMGTLFTRRFEADRITSQVPIKLMHLEGLYELFLSKFAYSTLDLSTYIFKVQFALKLTYRTVPCDDNSINAFDAQNMRSENLMGETTNETLWDNDCPWSEWYCAEDPVEGFELIAIWSEKVVESSTEMAELENASPYEAQKWLISPSFAPNLSEGSKRNEIGFASQLRLLVDALKMSFEAQYMEDFISDEKSGFETLKSSIAIPPPTVRDRVLKALFQEGVQLSNFAYGGLQTSHAIKGAPLESLFAQFCLHSLWFGNCDIQAIVILWIEFLQEIRWYWEESQVIPRMLANGSIDLSTCLINQKLQLLAVCIEKKREMNEEYHQDCIRREDQVDSMTEGKSVLGDESSNKMFDRDLSGNVDSFSKAGDAHYSVCGKPDDADLFNDIKPSDYTRRGSAGIVYSMMLLKSHQNMHMPYTQDAPLMTEDMHEEHLQAVEAFSSSFSFSARLESDMLASDMSTFKATNPDAVFEDFIRWHSPEDWVEDDLEVEMSKDNWPPRGKLSERTSEDGNLWRSIWNNTPALPASEQKPILDPNREGEKVLHYLETLQPHKLLEQMVCTAFRAAADTLIQTSYGELKQMDTMMQQLYLTMAPALRSLQVNRLSADSETYEDLSRLCVVFGHVENLLMLAASLHRKFLKTPRLAREIFSDFFKFYIPRMGIGLIEDAHKKEFDKKLEVWNPEREAVSNMFVPPTADQSWRRVSSMGNLLNGHEPILREIIFSLHDELNSNHYATGIAGVSQQKIETNRMYICGTSNDLRVALSAVSCD